jgi:hypothetical protein
MQYRVAVVMPNSAVEIHDSILNDLSIGDRDAVLNFSKVFIHQSAGRPLIDAGSVWVQSARLIISDAVVLGSFSDLPRGLLDGSIKMSGETLSNEIPIPLSYTGEVELRLESTGEIVTIKGKAAHLDLLGLRRYVEEFQPPRRRSD